MSGQFGALTRRSVHPASPVQLTRTGPLTTFIPTQRPLKRRRSLTHLKFENRAREGVTPPQPLIIRFT